jgi:hypothetical protein
MNDGPISQPEATKKEVGNLVLLIGALPVILPLLLLVLSSLPGSIFRPGETGSVGIIPRSITSEFFLHAACAFSAICGITSSIMIFRSRARVSIFYGITFLLVDGVISFVCFYVNALTGFGKGW